MNMIDVMIYIQNNKGKKHVTVKLVLRNAIDNGRTWQGNIENHEVYCTCSELNESVSGSRCEW